MKLSIIVPVYNVEKYLERCVSSLLRQTIDSYEIILVDDGSLDKSSSLCDEYSHKYENVKSVHKKNSGLGMARNTGLALAEGEFVAFVDSDDYIEDKMYQTLYEYATKNRLDAVYCSYDKIKNNKIDTLGILYSEKIYSTDINKVILGMIGNAPECDKDFLFEMSSCMSIYRKCILDKYNILFYSEKEFISEDLLFNVEFLSKAKRIATLPNTFYHYCMNDNSLTRTFVENRYQRDKSVYYKLKEELKKKAIVDDIFATERFILSRLRIQTKNIILKHDMSRQYKKRLLKELSEDETFIKIMQLYPIKKMKIKHRLFYVSMYRKYFWVVKLMYVIKEFCK